MDDLPPGQPQSECAIAPGQLIGSYRVERLLGEGGMASVFLATHERIRKRAAIKVLHPSYSRNSMIAERFLNEARAVNLIQHPGIVNIFEHGHLDGGDPYIIMDYLEGVALNQLIAAQQLEVAEALRLVRQTAMALAAAHDQGIVHRDLKPANIMIVADADGQRHAKVLDFGIAKVARPAGGDPLTIQADALMGTPAYMAPEQCFGVGNATPKSDVYALGLILYEMLAGRPAFHGNDQGELLHHHVYSSPPRLQTACPGLPHALCELVHAMLSKEPLRRPAMHDVALRLQQLPSPALAPAPERRSRLARAASLLAGALLLCLLATLGFLLWERRHSGTRTAPLVSPPPAAVPASEPPVLHQAPPPPLSKPPLLSIPAEPPREPPRRHHPPSRGHRPTNDGVPLLR